MGKTWCIKNNLLISLFLFFSMLPMLSGYSHAEESVCAEVKIEINQELTLERQAFDAHMRINNGLSHITLDNVQVEVTFADENGDPVLASSDSSNTSALFFIRPDTDNISGDSSLWTVSGGVPASTSVDLHWLIIPAPGASNGLESGTLYYIGATLTYNIGGEANETVVTPDYIYVKPMPELTLDYFLTQYVFGDDAWTPEIEAPVPFTLGVRVRNDGAGTARQLKIDSAQPKITENELGLLVGFTIEGSEINGETATDSLLIDFGDIAPSESSVGRWIMTCTLSGEFIDFTADLTHSDELGGELTSLLNDPVTHFLVRDVLVDLPGRDSVCDFLGTASRTSSVLWVYESDGTDTEVTDQSSGSSITLSTTSGTEKHYTLSTPVTSGFMYVNLSDPEGGEMALKSVIRSDGKEIKADNAWLSKIRKANPQEGWDYYVNLFDVNTTNSYTVVYDDTGTMPQAPVLAFIPDKKLVENSHHAFIVTSSDPNGTTPVLTASPLPAGASFTDQGDGTGVFDWTPAIGQGGIYNITFKASDGQFEDTQRVSISVCTVDDTDCDGMADDWEIDNFGNLDRDGTGDYDGDGISDLDEYLNGTNPTETDHAPTAPEIQSPLEGNEISDQTPDLIIKNSYDADGDIVTYVFELYADPEYTTLLASQADVAETTGTTSWASAQTLDDNTWYYWRVRATDGVAWSLWVYGSFFVNTGNDGPGAFAVSYPVDGINVDTQTPALEITNSIDPDEDDVSYAFFVYADSGLTSLVASSADIPSETDGTTSWAVGTALVDNTTYFWKAVAIDEHGAQSETASASFTVILANRAPSVPVVLSPAVGDEIAAQEIDLVAQNAIDPENDTLTYYVELDTADTFDSPAKQSSGEITEGTGTTAWHVSGLEDNTVYYWRVKANDGVAESSWATGRFFVNTANEAPTIPTINNPGQDAWVRTLTPTLSINAGMDPDNDALTYIIEVYGNSDLSQLIFSEESSATDLASTVVLTDNTRYYWRVQAEDEHEAASGWSSVYSFFVRTASSNIPPVISIMEPAAEVVTNDHVLIQWEDSDPDSNASISIYYDINDSGEDGILIADNIEENPDDTNDSYEWDVTGAGLEGTWYIYITITDGTSSETVYAPGVITVDRTPPTVTADPPGGSYEAPQTVTLSADEAADIYYTTDGSDPATTSALYDAPIEVTESATLKFMGIDAIGNQSEIIAETYTIASADLTVTVHTDTGMAVDGIPVYAFTEGGAYTGLTTVTDETGTAAFDPTDFSAGTYKFRTDYLGSQFWTDIFSMPGTAEVDLTIDVEDVQVTVTTAGGAAEGITVYLFSESGSYLGINGVTDADGHIDFTLPVGISFKFRADILGSQYWSDVAAITGGSVNYVSVDSGGGLFQITVREDAETPMAGISVYLFTESGSYLGRTQVTDTNGMAAFDVPSGNYKARADYLGYQFWSAVTTVTENTDTILTIAHHDVTSTVNAVYQGSSDPIEGVRVYLFTASGSYQGRNQTTNASGQVIFHLPDRAYKIRADYVGRQFWSEDFTAQDTVVDIPMADAEITVTGSGLPLAGINVYVFTTSGSYLSITSATDADGTVVFRLPAGSYKFRADYQDTQYWSAESALVADQVNPVEISAGGGTFELTVRKNETNPLEGVTCYVFSESGSYLGISAATSSDGTAFFNLADGSYMIRVDYLGYQFWTNVYDVPATLSDIFTIAHHDVTVTLNGVYQETSDPIENVMIYLYTAAGAYQGQYQMTNADGQVSFYLPEQAYKIRADYRGSQFWSEEFTAQDTVVDIPMADAEITVTGAGLPMAGINVYAYTASGSYLSLTAATDVDGKVTFRLPAASYKFRADYQGSPYWSVESALIADQVNPVEISTGGGQFTLTVLQNTADPLTGVSCYVFSESGSYLGLTSATDSAGQVVFNLADGNYKIRVDYLGNQFWTDIYEIPNILSDTFILPHKDVTITVEKVYQSPEPIDGVRVYLFSSSGSYMSRYQDTNAAGQVVFSLPDNTYKVRVDYLGNQFWSEDFNQADTTVTIYHGLTQVHVYRSGTDVDGARVYLFSSTGSYLSRYETTGADGITEFVLPDRSFKFRADEGGVQVYTQVITIQAGQVTMVDIDLDSATANIAPSMPGIYSPVDNGETTSLTPDLVIQNSTDQDGDIITYTFEIYSDPGLTALVAGQPDVAEGSLLTSWTVPATLTDAVWYYWRVRADDGKGASPWASAAFVVNTSGCNLYLHHETITDTQTYQTPCSIIVGPDVSMESGADITMQASEEVILNPGTVADQGSEVVIETTD